eukprot:611506-Rhodomonas_salina.1
MLACAGISPTACKCEPPPLYSWVIFFYNKTGVRINTCVESPPQDVDIFFNEPPHVGPAYRLAARIFCFEPWKVREHIYKLLDSVKVDDDVLGIDLHTLVEIHGIFMRQRDMKTMRIDLGMVKLSDELARKIKG